MSDPKEYTEAVQETQIIANREAAPETEREPYDLSDDALVKLGMKEADSTDGDKLGTATGTAEDDKKSESKGETDPQGQPGSEGAGEQDGDTGADDGADELTFSEKVQDVIDARIKDMDEDDQADFLKDLEKGLGDRMSFVTSVQQKSMETAEQRKQVDALTAKLSSDDVQAVIKAVLELDDLGSFLSSADDWYADEDANPIRALIETLQDKGGKVLEHTDGEAKLSQREADIALQEEILDLYGIDPSYKEIDKLKEVAAIADEHGISLKAAHQIRMGTALDGQLKEKDTEIDTLKKDLRKARKELKARNEQLSNKISTDPLSATTVGASGVGVNGDAFKTPSSGFDETEYRIHKKMGI
ncbi:MAG: hypothetical protein GY820_38740 [Gammaproteobacteria bacterium]|nr:hypothetical protein [Gammaproteobacteria bacterium]